MESPQDQAQVSERTLELVNQLRTIVSVEECNRRPELKSQVMSEYDVTQSFIELMQHFPEELAKIVEGQESIRITTQTYEIKPGIVAFPKMPYAHHRVDVLEFVHAVLEAVYRYTEGYTEVNMQVLNRFLHEYDKAVKTPEEERTVEHLILIKLAELQGVDEDILSAMRSYLRKDKGIKEIQRNSVFAKQEERRAREFDAWQRERAARSDR